MILECNLTLSPYQAAFSGEYLKIAAQKLSVPVGDITGCSILKKSLDARSGHVRILLTVRIFTENEPAEVPVAPKAENVTGKPEVMITGAGPAGLFAALKLIEMGVRPVVIERGKDVNERKKDIAELNTKHLLNPESNYCYGEGGAGTFSDGKLYTRSVKKGNVGEILDIFRYFGAANEISYEAHPHIGSDKLPGIVKNIRNFILDAGGEIRFNSRLTDINLTAGKITSVVINGTENMRCKAMILATGHSAHDIYHLLDQKKIAIESKPFAMGVRVEHPQELINNIQYHRSRHMEHLPAATYRLAAQAGGRGVYSFCMCPGGFIVPAATEEGSIVVNGMSPAARNSPYANSGIVVEIRQEDLAAYASCGHLAGLAYQAELEKLAWQQGGFGQVAPAQRLTDFVNNKTSNHFPKASYFPGFRSSPLHEWLPAGLKERLQQAFVQFDRQMRGFITNQAMVFGVESRTSSPVRIPRDPESLQHISTQGLFPCGEGAGYSGGIVSSAIDGQNCAVKAAIFVNSRFQ